MGRKRRRRHRQPIGERDYNVHPWWATVAALVALAILFGFAVAELLWVFVRFLAQK